MSKKRYNVIYYRKHYIHREIIASSLEEAQSYAWVNCPKQAWVEKVEEINNAESES
jgi:hypothetical protein